MKLDQEKIYVSLFYTFYQVYQGFCPYKQFWLSYSFAIRLCYFCFSFPLSSTTRLCLITELQVKLDQEKIHRQKLEAKLLEADKRKSELSVDVAQLTQSNQSLKAELRMEVEKVRIFRKVYPHLIVFEKQLI